MTSVSRRSVLRGLGTGAAALITLPVTADAAASEPSPASEGGRVPRYDNENAYGPSPRAVEAIRTASVAVHEYPEPKVAELRAKIARIHGVTPQQVVLGSGSTDVLRMVVGAALSRGKRLVAARPTCEVPLSLAASAGAEIVSVNLGSRHTHDLVAMLAASTSSTGLIYIANPHNPTGTVTPRADLDRFLEKLDPAITVVIDEAYHQYVAPAPDSMSFLEKRSRHDGVVVVRTFSKIHGLAGLRVGYAISSQRIASAMLQHAMPMGISSLAAVAAQAALDDHAHVERSAQRNVNDRQEFFNTAGSRMVRLIDSQANFVMIDAARPATGVIAHFAAHGIALPGVIPNYDTYVRVSIGTAAQMKEFWRVWDLQPGIHSH